MSEIVDLRSDTLTKPTDGMRAAMAAAEVGDDVYGEDPTVNRLQERAAELLGKEAALFVPSGTMANLIGFLTQSRPGDTAIMSKDAHPYNYEGGNIAAIGGLMTRLVDGECGLMTRTEIEPFVVRSADHHLSETPLISVENTTNRGGGNIYSLEALADIRALADEHGMKIHCDGARLFNAVVASGHSAADFAQYCDTVCFCFSKGLGAPVGSIIAGSADTIHEAHRFRKLLGGGMRQAGVLAAAALYSLDEHIDRLADDHRRAQEFRAGLEGAPGIHFPMPTPTNIVLFDVENAGQFSKSVGALGVEMFDVGVSRIRAVFHLDIDDEGLGRAIEACVKAAEGIAVPK